ncbi:MAG: FAD-dependent oxidoreductase, partial [Firmicutes bacterium]|nr:FAD-dependent oxidoreductase [Bacillota bacterium]
GALPIRPPIPGIEASNLWFLRTVDDAVTLRAFLESRHPQYAVVIGAGFIGLEVVEALLRQHLSVTLVEMAPQVLPPLDGEMAAVVATALRKEGVELVLGDGIAAFEGEQEANGVVLQSGRRIRGDLFVAGLGVRSNVALAKEAGLRLGSKGGIWVDAQMRTSDPEIFAAGDAVEGLERVTAEPALFALAGPANKQGRIAGENAAGGNLNYHGALGTAIVRSGSVVAAITGISQRRAETMGIPYQVNYIVTPHHAAYYPGGKEILIKLLWSPNDGRVLGAQIVGGSGVDKRIDVLATAIWNGMTIDGLADLDLAYAPPFSSAKDPVILAGMAASNRQRGFVDGIIPEELDTLLTVAHRLQLVDVRDPQEFQSGIIAGAINLPLDQLREQLEQLDPNADTVVFCRSGQRSYQAERILVQHGFRHVRNLSGGYLAWSAYITSKSDRAPLAKAYLQEEFLR